MRYLKKAIILIKKGDFSTLFKRVIQLITGRIWSIISKRRDKRIGNKELTPTIPSKFAKIGAFATQSTDYRCLDVIFKKFPLTKEDIFIDIGCGEGRVLTYVYTRGFRGKIIGIELDPDVANTAKERTGECKNIEIINKNVLECSEVFKNATVYYLFNPFNKDVLLQLLKKIEENTVSPLRLYYCNDLFKSVIVGRKNWSVIHEGVIKRIYTTPMNYSIYKYTP